MTCKQNYNEVTILLIDDDDVDVMGVKRALKQLKILNPIIRARDGVEGLAIIRDTKKQRKSYIVLLDKHTILNYATSIS